MDFSGDIGLWFPLLRNISKKNPATNTTHNKTMKTKTFITAAVLATAMHASAAITIIDPISVSKEGGGVPQSGSLSQVIDNSGLSFDLNTGDLVPSTLPTHDGGLTYTNNAVRWFTFDLLGAEVPDALIFDLGQLYSTGLGDILFWNYSEQARQVFTHYYHEGELMDTSWDRFQPAMHVIAAVSARRTKSPSEMLWIFSGCCA